MLTSHVLRSRAFRFVNSVASTLALPLFRAVTRKPHNISGISDILSFLIILLRSKTHENLVEFSGWLSDHLCTRTYSTEIYGLTGHCMNSFA